MDESSSSDRFARVKELVLALRRSLVTLEGQLIGTPEYMSPKQAEGGGKGIDTRTDIYSLGVLLYELLVGGLPFDPDQIGRSGPRGEPGKPSDRVKRLADTLPGDGALVASGVALRQGAARLPQGARCRSPAGGHDAH